VLNIRNRFRWAFCQLEPLRYCLPPSVRHTLDELPESLDETYERVLREIKKPNRLHARRLLQCLAVAIRPLNVKELAEVLAVDFDDADGIPRLKTNWRWEDQEQALLSSCSSLITIVEADDSRIVQFSHFSVKEYLTSARLATSDVSRYHIDLEPAHTILAQACMGVLLQPDNVVEESEENSAVEKKSPLAGYAARHWVTHAHFERVSSFLRKAMEYFFDLDMPYFVAWVQLYDIDTYPIWTSKSSSSLHWFAVIKKSGATPLYIAALCGFQDLVEHLVVKYPQHVNASGGHYVTPLVAALAGRHFQTAKLLHHNGAHVNVRGNGGEITLCSAAWYGDLEMVQVLLNLKVDANDRGINNWTPIHRASQGPEPTLSHMSYKNTQLLPDVARLLLEHGADVNARIERGLVKDEGKTPLHMAADHGRVEVARVLLEHDANVGAEDNKGSTPLHEAAVYGRVEVVRVLLEHGTNVGAEDNKGRTPLHEAADYRRIEADFGRVEDYASGKVEVVRVLLEHGANVGAEDKQGRTPLHKAAKYGEIEVVRMLLERDANVGAEDNKGRTPFWMASAAGEDETMKLLLEHGAKGVYSISSLCLP
jgi:ankyrin repeat protein